MLVRTCCLLSDIGVSEAELPSEDDPTADRPTPMRVDLELPLLEVLLLRSMACKTLHVMPHVTAQLKSESGTGCM